MKGLFIVWDKYFRKVEVEFINVLLIELILTGEGVNSSLTELRLLHQLLHRKWEVRVRHIPRDKNGIEDHMAKYTAIRNSLLQLFKALPVLIKELLSVGCNGSSLI